VHKIIRVISFAGAIAALLISSGCSSHSFPVRRPIVDQPVAMYSRAKAQEYYVRARDFERRGLLKIAEREYENALQFDSESRVLKQQLVRMYITSGKFTQALLLIKGGKKAAELDREDKRIVSTIYLKMNEIEKAAWLLETIPDKTAEEAYSLGWIYESLGNREKAITFYLKCFAANSEEVQLGYKIAKMMLQAGRYTETDSFLVELEGLSGKSPDLFMLRGTVAIAGGDTTKGVALFDSSLAIDSLHEETLRNKAQLFIERADFDNAIGCYEKLTTFFSYGEMYSRTLALLYFHNGQFDKSESTLQKLLENAMDDAELHYYLGMVYAATSRQEYAVIEYEKSLSLKNDREEVWRELCAIYLKKRLFDQAADVAERFTVACPDKPSSWRLKGYVSSLQKNYPAVIRAYKKALTFDSTDTYALFEMGSAYERQKQSDSAEIAFRKVLTLRPKDASTLNYLGYMWAERGERLDSARVYLSMALEQDPRNGAYLDSYAWIMYQSGLYDSALVYIDSAALLIDDDPVVFSHLGDILVKTGKLREAIDAYKKSIELHSEEEQVLRQKIIDTEILLNNE